MSSKPTIYCCIPRLGIIFMSLVFGCLGIIPSIFAFPLSDVLPMNSFTAFINCLSRFTTIISTVAFFYSAYLVYKRRYKPFKYLLYIVWASTFFDACSGVVSIKDAFQVPSHEHDFRIQVPYNALENSRITEEQYFEILEPIMAGIRSLIPFVTAFFTLFPLLNKIYFILKMKSYVDYIKYKKEEARPVPAVDLPHKLPDCRQ